MAFKQTPLPRYVCEAPALPAHHSVSPQARHSSMLRPARHFKIRSQVTERLRRIHDQKQPAAKAVDPKLLTTK